MRLSHQTKMLFATARTIFTGAIFTGTIGITVIWSFYFVINHSINFYTTKLNRFKQEALQHYGKELQNFCVEDAGNF